MILPSISNLTVPSVIRLKATFTLTKINLCDDFAYFTFGGFCSSFFVNVKLYVLMCMRKFSYLKIYSKFFCKCKGR